MAEITLTATPRSTHGTRPSRRLRAEGKVPAVVYGIGDAVPITVEWRELRQALTTDQGLNAVIHLKVDGEVSPTLVKALQRHPVRRDVLHVDFIRVDLDKPVDVEVPIHLEGEATAVQQADGGVVDQVLSALLITAKPADIPPSLTVNIDSLEIGSAIRVGDIALPEGVTTPVDAEEAVVSAQIIIVQVPEPEEVEEGEEAAEGEEGAAAEGEEGEAAEGEGGDAEEGESGSDSGT